jgi:3-phenylpropionate/cinnamic acid dioxygenase small subunit
MTDLDGPRADKFDIAEVLVRYATGIDRRDWDLFRSCFTDDVIAEYDGVDTWTSVDAITEFMIGAHADMGHTMHQLSNLAIEVVGDAATTRCYVDGILMASDGQSGLNVHGFYDDQFVRMPQGWRIARRRFTMVHVHPLD